MKLVATGIVTNQYNDILLIQRDDTLTWAPPGGSILSGELPTDGVAREVREETGMVVLPVRLVSTSFWPGDPYSHLHLTFRCLIRGGVPTPSAEAPQVGFFDTRALPRPMMAPHRERIEKARFHTGPAIWFSGRGDRLHRLARQVRKVLVSLRRDGRLRPETAAGAAEEEIWSAAAYVLLANAAGETLWVPGDGGWVLPGGPGVRQEAPWETAARLVEAQTGLPVALRQLAGIFVRKGARDIRFVFRGEFLDRSAPVKAGRYFGTPPGMSPFAGVIQALPPAADEPVIRYWPAGDAA